MMPTLIGYFAVRSSDRKQDERCLPPHVRDMCHAGVRSADLPCDWDSLDLHNKLWVYNTELWAWAVAIDNFNLHRLRAVLSESWDGSPGSIQNAMGRYIAHHVPLPAASFQPMGERFEWQLYAYKMYPVRFAGGKEAPYDIEVQGVQPLPSDYLPLGLDVVSREHDRMFCHSPLDCNGYYNKVPVNPYCLLDELKTAFQLARSWSDGKYNSAGHYIGNAEPGPYFVVEVFRKKMPEAL